ncbi:MetQ/NlpA family ABC transporter substrate-binding protein [Paenibacillus qinlingensis]|uniref:MetQ/NlpA family ABC transporter substrate-binding protein n=1 Tax=Paenibacillus qinlingensis TaxID=1837343 RepID=UPI00156756AD|nr:MetQ/NlpA family ABC transporter substrate-binding protein [Paenibacillus qinlingensis]NQX60607.1 methionine ABC transporter substrate-binding protein [Paenibacillus qinlingensis]
MIKKRLFSIVSLSVGFSVILAGCGAKTSTEASNSPKVSAAAAAAQSSAPTEAPKKEVTLTIGSAEIPHSEILNFVKPKLKEQGINLQVKVTDEDLLNQLLKDKQIDANYFQHVPYFDSVKTEKGFDFVNPIKVHVEPIGFYSTKLKSKDEIKEGAKIGIPNNPSNEYRALVLLQQQGLIKLKDGLSTYQATPKDIVSNPKNLKFVEAEAPTLARSLQDLDGAVINTNIVIEAKIDPKTALFREDANSPYANVITVRKGDENRDEIKKLGAALTSPEVKKFILDKYGVAVVPAF